MKNIALILSVLTLFSGSAQAATKFVKGVSLTNIMLTGDGAFGDCMVAIPNKIADFGLNCAGSYVTFSCSGDHTSKARATKMLDLAQMAFAMDKKVDIFIDDSKKHNNYCFARRINLTK